ncbi:hypothetical protein [Breznakiella homolactica]|uniref:Uncharacterized protein n=1 Tax=Breznakiella homolactica TaxID=2798577 RepID=A0A7T8BBE1_9SPIR|nr:hypothetical protein [Breznakiella homolactica]QQO09138.1 hypothetical protein JFL75_19755 [Breznakiella homolactica]
MKVLLDNLYPLHRDDSKTNVSVEIPLDRDYGCLEFLCSYTPKVLENEAEAKDLIEAGLERFIPPEYRERYGGWRDYLPVVNLITLSLDHDEIYVGCAHRHNPEQRHIVSADFSSPGFFRHSASAGVWRAVINVHAVVSDETVYHLTVNAYDKDEVPDDNL